MPDNWSLWLQQQQDSDFEEADLEAITQQNTLYGGPKINQKSKVGVQISQEKDKSQM